MSCPARLILVKEEKFLNCTGEENHSCEHTFQDEGEAYAVSNTGLFLTNWIPGKMG